MRLRLLFVLWLLPKRPLSLVNFLFFLARITDCPLWVDFWGARYWLSISIISEKNWVSLKLSITTRYKILYILSLIWTTNIKFFCDCQMLMAWKTCNFLPFCYLFFCDFLLLQNILFACGTCLLLSGISPESNQRGLVLCETRYIVQFVFWECTQLKQFARTKIIDCILACSLFKFF